MPTPEEIRAEKLSNIPASLKNAHLYCEKCGAIMGASKINKHGLFNRRTGTQAPSTILYTWHCSSGLDGHDYLEVS